MEILRANLMYALVGGVIALVAGLVTGESTGVLVGVAIVVLVGGFLLATRGSD